jgi:hypothetical protein
MRLHCELDRSIQNITPEVRIVGQTTAINLICQTTPSEAILVTPAALELNPIWLIEILFFFRCRAQC